MGEWMGPGGPHGLQLRWRASFGVRGGFDSLALPPSTTKLFLKNIPDGMTEVSTAMISFSPLIAFSNVWKVAHFGITSSHCRSSFALVCAYQSSYGMTFPVIPPSITSAVPVI